LFKPDTANLFIDYCITMSKLFGINVQYTVIKRYYYFEIKPPKALFVKVHTLFTHMHIKMQLVWTPPFNELVGKAVQLYLKDAFWVSYIVGLYIHVGKKLPNWLARSNLPVYFFVCFISWIKHILFIIIFVQLCLVKNIVVSWP